MKASKCFDRTSRSWDCEPRITGLIRDPIEEPEAHLSIETELEEKLRSYFSDRKFDSGSWFHTPVSCFEYWQVMKRFLWEDYRIEWRSPVELNPTIFKDDLQGVPGVRMVLFGVGRGGTKGGGCEWMQKAAAGTPTPSSIVVLGDEGVKHKPIPCE